MRFLLLIICCITIPGQGFSQWQRVQDSTAVAQHHLDFDSLIHIDAIRAKVHLDSLLEIANRDRYPGASYFYLYDKAYYHFTRHEMKVSNTNFEKALAYAETLNLPSEVIMSTIWLANHQFFKNNIVEARKLYLKVLALSEELDFTYGIANAYFGLSSLETDEENVLKYLIKIDSVYQDKNTKSAILANALGEIGQIYLNSGNHTKAKQYLEKSLELAHQTNYIPGISNYTVILGEIALEEGNYEEAYGYFQSAYDESARKKDTLNVAHMLQGLARIDMKTNRLRQAEERMQKALLQFRHLKDSVSLTITNLHLAELYLKRKDLPKAKSYLDYVEHYGHNYPGDNYQIKLLKTSVSYWIQAGDYRQAFLVQSEIDSLENIERSKKNTEAFMALEQKFNADKKEQEIAILRSQNELSEQQKRNQRNLLLGGIGLTSVAGIFIFFLYRNRQKTNRKLQEIDRMKSRFFANISHEFRTPLTLISAPIEQKLSNGELNEKERSDFEMMQRNNQRLLDLVDQLLDLSKIEAGRLKLQVENGEPLHLIKGLSDAFTHAANQKDIEYRCTTESQAALVWFDKDALEKMVVNLLSNAIKYTPVEGRVECTALLDDQRLIFEVKNTGRGLSKEQLKKVFERFYQADEHSAGTGIGLALVHELVALHRGTISADSEKDGWTTFRVVLPVDSKSFKESEIHTSPNSIERPKPVTHGELRNEDDTPISDNDLPILLVVDDHADVRALLKQTFEKGYNILTAKNGAEGVKLAIDRIPDLIISDVMMPVKDGIALARKLKNDERTCHIPIILLTAKAGEENEVAGIETGADDYITKPFSTKILTSKVGQLIELRQQLQSRYSQEIILKPKDIAITGMDEQFLEKIQAVLDEKLTESNFNTQEFSEAVGMSRMQLHRKLKALTGLTASEFIRSQRLKLGASLLQNSNANVSEIAYKVGFNDPSYFTKCFKEVYGSSPTEFISN
ncbi:MAG TPA: ATP-binding protein [Eudoraea sp.]|nr:ATP-binding protein [Eudoraea sp.]